LAMAVGIASRTEETEGGNIYEKVELIKS
jgi:hypothetical protein